MKMKVFFLFALIVLAIVCWQFAGFLWGFQSPLQDTARLIVLAIACLLFGSALVLAARRLSANIWISAGLLVLPGLFLPASTFIEIFPASSTRTFPGISVLLLEGRR